MTETMPNGVAPTGTKYKIGAKGGKVGQAWQLVWDRLDATEYRDASELAKEVAEAVGLQPVSIMSHLHRMAAEGHLDSTVRYTATMVHKFGREYPSQRKRMHVRMPVQDQAA